MTSDTASAPSDPRPDALAGFLDDAGPLPVDGPPLPHPSPRVGHRAVRDDDLPRLRGYAGALRLVVTGGPGQLAGPAGFCVRHDLGPAALDLAVRDPSDPVGTAHRVVAALLAAEDAGDLPDGTVVHVRVQGEPTPAWLAAADVLAEAEVVLALPLDAGDPAPWIDAALDRELAVSLTDGSPALAVAALRTTARLWGDEHDLARARRWCRSWVTDDVEAALAHLADGGDAAVAS